ncbi:MULTISPECIES: enoyl-CoA hydratase-related protein [Hyphomonas]|uniref:Enoyl-CoA hydratase n=1 Tax=Hyphomonas adhaerens TaxID=81029 RepID=A0A3B9GXT4_9PROT|nr:MULTISPECIES: enoyl-CoA hydratase-related protein [Hyphomonas]MBB41860.1 enoyl-CoA hydratase [Hyphomonas sp.]HAE27026.1 enoyl-CoA hydratase [Hyphomonas adhaerens]|tara:strand:+ start:795 stop:1649 length:855 start_codon:yes stop_codon:yes gene_type:complete
MAYEQVLLEKDGPAAIITLNRPEKLNAFTNQLGRELADAIRACDADDDVRGIIITGAGRHFCAGADISDGADAFDTKSGSGAKNFGTSEPGKSRDGAGFIGAMYACQKPLIAAFNGAAVGVGITMMLPTDIKIASEKAKFGFVFAQRGLPPEAGSAWFLPQLVGLPQALRWCMTGKVFEAQEALEGGLISEIHPPEELLPAAKRIVAEIAQNTAPVSVALVRQLLWRFGPAADPFDLLKVDGQFALTLGSSPDVKEGVTAFLEKRAPNFPGKVSADMPDGYPWW